MDFFAGAMEIARNVPLRAVTELRLVRGREEKKTRHVMQGRAVLHRLVRLYAWERWEFFLVLSSEQGMGVARQGPVDFLDALAEYSAHLAPFQQRSPAARAKL